MDTVSWIISVVFTASNFHLSIVSSPLTYPQLLEMHVFNFDGYVLEFNNVHVPRFAGRLKQSAVCLLDPIFLKQILVSFLCFL